MTDQPFKSRLDRNSTLGLVDRLMRENLRPYIGRVFLAMTCMAIVAACQGLSAWLMKPVVNEIFVGRNFDMLWIVSGGILGTFLVKGIANYAQAAIMSWVGLRIINDNQNRLFRHLSRMELAFFHAQSTGRLISRFTIDINNMRVAVSNALTSFGKDFMMLIALVSVMFTQNWELALISFFVFPVAIYPIARLGRRMRKVTANTQEEMGLFSTLLEQTFQGIRVVKAYGMEDYERGRVADVVDRIFRLNYKAARTRALSSPIMETLGGSAVAVVVVYGGYQVIEARIDPGSFFAFITALLMAYEPLKRLANLNASLQEGLAGAQRLFDVLDTRPTLIESPGARDLKVAGGTVHLDGVSFSYDGEHEALSGLDMQVPAGKTVALVGPSGAGKSTILNLIPRFYDVTKGRVTIDGQDVRELTFSSLRASIALVSQEVMLFDDTIRANIAYGRAGATEEQILQAARDAAAHEFIVELPEGYDTTVGEQGVKLSGGQRQRLAIARAMLKNAPILLLDEATSALDTESERKVQAALERLVEGRTTIVIAHRLSTVTNADIINVVDHGRIVESGSHTQLMEQDGIYARLYSMQFEQEAEAVAELAAMPEV